MRFARRLPCGADHLDALAGPLDAVRSDLPRIERWGSRLFDVLTAGGRLMACGNGGSAAEAQHLTSELFG
jgi:D-sedoheptulose 7-phosphate isomerase